MMYQNLSEVLRMIVIEDPPLRKSASAKENARGDFYTNDLGNSLRLDVMTTLALLFTC